MDSTAALQNVSFFRVSATFLVLYLVYIFVLRPLVFPDPNAQFWQSFTRVGTRKGWLGPWRSSLAALSNSRNWVRDGYQQYSKTNKIFALPRFGTDPLVVLPASKVQTLIHYPESVVSQKKVLHDFVATVTGDHDLQKNPIHIDLIRNQLTRKLALITGEVYDELVLAMREQWPAKSNEWTQIKAVDTCTQIISRAANRAFCGAELCRNADLLHHIGAYSHDMFVGVALVNLLPLWLRPLLAPLIVLPARKHLKIAKQLAVPTIQQRLDNLLDKTNAGTPPNDALQWLIEDCVKKNDPAELDPVRICRRIIRVNMVAIHTTSTTITNTILDLYSSTHTEEFVAGLREECTRVLAAHGGHWTKAAVNELYRVDSTIKESMRLSGIFIAGMVRVIAQKGGVDFGDGIHIPEGIRVGAPNSAIHMDPEVYENPTEFDPFRFSRVREQPSTTTASTTTSSTAAPVADDHPPASKQPGVLDHKAAVTTSDTFLSFGHGRGACPGRFFASQEMKLMLAHVVMTYDVRVVGKRPKNRDLGAMSIPNGEAVVEIRLREEER